MLKGLNIKCGVFCSIVLLLHLTPLTHEAAAILPIFSKDAYNEFFRVLSPEEQQWIMKLAVWYSDSDGNDGVISPLPINTGGGATLPSDGSLLLPDRLVLHFLNGDVPKSWQKEFTKWLTKEFKLKKRNFQQFRETGIFCNPSDSCDLVDLSNVGGICCPFG